MPWKETRPVDERIQFIAAVAEDPRGNFARLCERFGISRAKGYKWLRRYEELGAAWVVRSHAIEYLRPAFVDDDLRVRTWVSDMSKVSSRRKTTVSRADGATLARCETLWVFVSRRAHALDRVPPELAAAFPLVPDAPPRVR